MTSTDTHFAGKIASGVLSNMCGWDRLLEYGRGPQTLVEAWGYSLFFVSALPTTSSPLPLCHLVGSVAAVTAILHRPASTYFLIEMTYS